MVNSSEKKIKMMLEGKGYTVLHKGSPDFMCYKLHPFKVDRDKVLFVEVKSGQARLTEEQKIYNLILQNLGAKVAIVRSDDPDSIVRMLNKC